MQHGDYSSYYQYQRNPNPNLNPTPNPPPPYPPNPASLAPSSYASAPPYSATSYTEYSSSYPSSYPSYHQNPDPSPPTAPSFSAQPTPPPVHQPPFSSSFPQFETHGSYQPQSQPQPQPQTQTQTQPPHQPYYPTYDQFQPPHPNYSSPSPYPNPKAVPTSSYSSSLYPPSSATPAYDSPYDGNYKMDQSGGLVDDFAGRYGSSRRERSDFGSYGVDEYGEGVYAYQGSKVEPYGARGTAPKSSTWSSFDDFGRPIGNSIDKNRSSGSSTKIVKAVPKAEAQLDVKSGVQKFRVKLLAESGGQSTMDVLCQIGLDGIRMLDPSTSRTLRIYSLDTVTRCETTDSSILSFWSKTSVDIEPRRIRLQSNSYTTSTLLDTVTAAIVQYKEMGGRSRPPPPESTKMADQPTEKKKGLADWMNFMKPTNEEKDYWVPDEAVAKCTSCGTDFNAFVRRHHCRNCGDVFCDKCTQGRIALTAEPNAPSVRVCDRCMAEVSHRLSNAKETSSRSCGMPSHEDLAKKLHEEMERNRISSSGSKASNSSGKRMKEVACPTCTVHLQVQVPSSGSETIECGVCQHPFLVSAH